VKPRYYGFEVLEAPKHLRPWKLDQPGRDDKVPTCSAVLSSCG
jgi:hypothetical protein